MTFVGAFWIFCRSQNNTEYLYRHKDWQRTEQDKYIFIHPFIEENDQILNFCDWKKYENICFQYVV